MRKYNVVFLTTVFPSSRAFLDQFFNSLANQTFKSFDILVINDGIEDFFLIKEKYAFLNVIEVKSNKTPSINREYGINTALKFGYKIIIFGDSDDYFSYDRVQKSIFSLETNDLVFNELNLFSKDKLESNYLSNNIQELNNIEKNILESNVLGFSNTAIRTESINKMVSFSEKLIAIDWFFFTTFLLARPLRVSFQKDIFTYYRQHDNNTIGISKQLSNEKLMVGIETKEIHYNSLVEYYEIRGNEIIRMGFQEKLNQIQFLKNKLKDKLFRQRYINVINFNIDEIFNGWWSEIITTDKFLNYENSINK